MRAGSPAKTSTWPGASKRLLADEGSGMVGSGVLDPDAVHRQQILGETGRIMELQVQRVVAGLEGARQEPARKERADVVHDVPVGVPDDLDLRVRVDPDEANDLHREAGFF